MQWSEQLIQCALTREPSGVFGFLRYNCIPNVKWSFFRDSQEADLLCFGKSGVLHNIEIKISTQDLRADLAKRHKHYDRRVKHLWFAVPETLVPYALETIPEKSGLISVAENLKTKIIRRPKPNNDPYYRKPTQEELYNLLRAGTMRMWSQLQRSLTK